MVSLGFVSCADGEHPLLGLAPRVSSARTFQCVCLLPWSGHETLVGCRCPALLSPLFHVCCWLQFIIGGARPAAVPSVRVGGPARGPAGGRLNISSLVDPSCNSRVILKRHGEFIYTPPRYLCYAAEKRQPPLVSVSLRPALNPPPSLSSAPHDEATAEREHYSVSVCACRSIGATTAVERVSRRVTRANLQPFSQV